MLKMRKMEDSGIEWIRDIPEGWEVAKLKNIVSIVRGGSPRPIEAYMSDNDNDVNWIRISDTEKGSKYITHTSRKLIASGISKSRFIKRGSLILTNSMSFGEPYILDIDGCIHDGWVAFSDFKKIDKEFLYYFLTSPLAKIQFEQQVDGGVVKNLNIDKIGDTVILLPSLIDQNKIIAHLDSLTSETNSLLSKTITSIEEYKKLKQAVITHAVTKGVRGEREMKDSGVEWIGKIPREFDPVQLKFFCKLITDGTHFSPTTVENGWPYITAGDVHGIGLDYNSAKRISEEDFQLLVAQGCQPLKGDVLLVKDGATTGRVGFVDSDTPCVILSSVAMLRPATNTDGHYLMYLLASDFLQKQILVSMAGSAMPRTTLTKLTKYIGLLPPLHEQKEIADYLDAKCAEIDGLIAKKEQLVKELESYKKSLIYEVVTGKREV